MKKRVKLLTTIASLCLAVALMAFGVYAATTASFTITNKVSFTAAKNVKATVTLSVSDAEWDNITEAKPAEVDDGDWTVTLLPSTEDQGELFGDWTLCDSLALTPKSLEMNEGKNATMKVGYTVTIKNNALGSDTNKVLHVKLDKVPAGLAQDETDHKFTFTTETETGAQATAKDADIKVLVGETLTIKVLLTIDTAKSLTLNDLGLGFTLSANNE